MNADGRINARLCSNANFVVCQKPQKTIHADIRSTSVSCGETFLPSHITDSDRVVGGNLIDIEEFPWIVKVLKDGAYECNGVLISSTHLLTAAHCVTQHDNILDKSKVTIMLGSQDKYAKSGMRETVHMIHIHFNYTGNQQNIENDIAVIELSRKIPTDCPRMGDVCFMDEVDSMLFAPPYAGYECVLADFDSSLRYCEIHNLDYKHPYYETKYQISANRQYCTGWHWNSGTPLVCKKDDRWSLAGLKVAAGTNNLLLVNPSKHRHWINTIVESKYYSFIIIF